MTDGRRIIALVFSLVLCGNTFGDVIYPDRTQFINATQGGSLSHFGFNANFAWAPVVDFGAFTVSAASGDVFTSSAASEGAQAAGFAGPSATITFDTPINAFAIDLVDWGTNPSDFLPAGSRELRVANDTGSFNHIVATADAASGIDLEVRFFGVVSNTPFSSVTVSKTTSPGDSIGLDNMLFGSVTAIPEPSAGLMFGWLLIGQTIWLRRRRSV